MVSTSVKALSLMCDDSVVEKTLLFGSSYSLDELESGDGNGGNPSSSRNPLCLIVAFWIVFSIISNAPWVAARSMARHQNDQAQA
jgi:hypothetical protein